ELAHAGQPERFAQLLEGLWQQILKSSPTVPSEACALPHKFLVIEKIIFLGIETIEGNHIDTGTGQYGPRLLQ
ncbi:hypothetical protein, partial [Gemmiger formicilis]|uniref:hypothetical protein n=1 Tax=Gemmiger formicilis TaxID=745368 RepID=UPI00195AC2A5